MFASMTKSSGQLFFTSDPDLPRHVFTSWPDKERQDYSGWQRKLFAGKLKDMLCMLIGCTRDDLEYEEFKDKPLGEEWCCWLIPVGGSKFPRIFPYTYTIEQMEHIAAGDKFLKREMTPRMLLQLLGTECGRNIIHPNIWVNALMKEYKSIGRGSKHAYRVGLQFKYARHEDVPKDLWETVVQHPETNAFFYDVMPNWVVTDVRFPSEVEAIKKVGGIVVRVNGPIYEDGVRWTPENGNTGYYNVNGRTWKDRRHISSFKLSTHESETALDDYKHFDYVIDNNGTPADLMKPVVLMLNQFKLI